MSAILHRFVAGAARFASLSGPLQNHPEARMLHAVGLGMLGVLALHIVVLAPFGGKQVVASAIIAFVLAAIVATLFLLRSGRMRAASVIFLGGVWAGTTFAIVLNGGIRSIGLTYLVVLPISAAWLLGFRSALWMAAVTLAGSLGLAIMDTAGVRLLTYFPGLPMTSWMLLVQSILITAVPVGIVLRSMRQALARSEAAEQALRNELAVREHMEESLRESEAQFRNVANLAPVMIWASDAEHSLTFLNDRLLTFLGGTFEEWRHPLNWQRACHPDDRANLRGNVLQDIEQGSNPQFEFRMRRSDTEYRILRGTGVPRVVNGSYRGYIGVLSDLTDLRKDQENIFEAQKLESLGVVATGVAHDFNNLLGAILASAENALSELPSNSDAVHDLDRIRLVSLRGSEIVGQLMDYAGASDTNAFEVLDLNDLIREFVPLFQISVAKTAELDIRLADESLPVRGSAPQLRQTLMNLVSNASDALHGRAGRITIATSRTVVKDAVEANGVPPGDYASLLVSDTGCGITPEIQARMFDAFYSTKGPGRGLGLASVRGMVCRSSGTISVKTEVGHGTTFDIFLPYSMKPVRATAVTLRSTSEGTKSPLAGRTVLVIEDEEALRSSVASALKRSGLTVLTAGDGLSGVSKFRSYASEVDIVLLDMTLPQLSGRQVLEEIRQLKTKAKIIVTSGYGSDYLRAADGEFLLRQERFIRKPYQTSELLHLLQESLVASEPFRTAP